MNEPMLNDEPILIDFLLDRLEDGPAREVRARLASDEAFRRRCETLRKTFAALDLAEPPELGCDLVEATMKRIAAAHRTNELLALQEASRPRAGWPTFSLRELAAIAAALVLLVTVLVPSIRNARFQAQATQCASQMGQIGAGMQTYAINNAGFLPAADSQRRNWLPVDSAQHASNSAGPFKLLAMRLVRGPTVFQCPAVGGPSFTVEPGMTDFPRAVHITFSYQYSVGGRRVNILHRNQAPTAYLADQTPVFANGHFQADRAARAVSENHAARGQNVLMIDGRVLWVTGPLVGESGDNIFLIRGRTTYRGDEAPDEPDDAFLLPAFGGGE